MVIVVAIVLAAVAAWVVVHDEPRPSRVQEVATRVLAPHETSAARAADAPPPSQATKRAHMSRAEREVMHRRIVESLQRHADAANDRATPPDRDDRVTDDEEKARAPIRNRLGDDDPWGDVLVKRLGDDFGPLGDECIADLRERVPDLAGMVAIDVTVVGDEDIGGVVESAAASHDNEIDDPQFLECMRESMLSTVLPAPPGRGRRDFVLSLHVEDDP